MRDGVSIRLYYHVQQQIYPDVHLITTMPISLDHLQAHKDRGFSS